MSESLATTWNVLGSTRNGAAVSILLPLLDSSDSQLAGDALRTLLKRRSEEVHRQLLRRWSTLSDEWKSIIRQRPGCMSGVFRSVVLDRDAEYFDDACDALLGLREYDLVSSLITASEDRVNPHAPVAAATLVKLVELLHEELVGERDYRKRRDPQLVRKHVLASLEKSIGRYGDHKCKEIIEAFLMLTGRDNPILKKVLLNPHAKCYLPVIELLSTSPRPGIMRLLLSYLDDPHAPTSAINAAVNRHDAVFLRSLFRKTGYEPSDASRTNLRKVKSIAWLTDEPQVLNEIDEAGQHAALQLLLATRVNRLKVFAVVRYLLKHGNVGGRRAAAAALEEFKGAEANRLVVQALDDPDPKVQAHALLQLRQRGIPGALTKLIAQVDSPHEVVRSAARRSLDEFRFTRYLSAYDMLEEEVRKSTGMLVKKVDPQTIPLIVKELTCPSRTRRLRALSIVAAMDIAEQVEEPILTAIADDDHFVRTAAADALRRCDTTAARAALREALQDRSVSVRDAAERSLLSLTAGPPPPVELNVTDTILIPEPPESSAAPPKPALDDEPLGRRNP